MKSGARGKKKRIAAAGAILFGFLGVAGAQRPVPNLVTNIERPLRYRPDGADFVIEDGNETFNRPLYGGNTAFRVDGGDRPEFVLYLPGRGGNLRLGIARGNSALWLHDARRIVTRYRPGQLLYEIRDPAFGDGVLRIAAIARHDAEGLIVRAESTGLSRDAELIWAFGGVNGQRGRRGGDIGTESVPISEWFQLKPEFCRGNRIEIEGSRFVLRSTSETIEGAGPSGTRFAIGDASRWSDVRPLFFSTETRSATNDAPVVLGRVPLADGTPVFVSLHRRSTAPSPAAASDPSADFAGAERHFESLRTRVSIDTPDPFLDAAMGALNVAADAVWDEPQRAIMHGAIAWRQKLLGWRGPYALDALGWTDRAREHFESWASQQKADPIPESPPSADPESNLSRSERALHSNGALSFSHYDMNAVYIDALFRHLSWTGDVDFAKRMWPVIERHLAWERRLFRREFGPRKLPLYEAYAMIWASDDLQYGGGGTAHASAYNYAHNRMAAKIAPLVGADPGTYAREADLIATAMRDLLWMKDAGMFAEAKDWLGEQRIHPSPALWSFYVAMDAGLPTPAEATAMARYVDTALPHLPVRGDGVPSELHTLATSNWMPYTWSINNVVMGEAVHTALGFWQTGRPEDAWRIAQGSLLAAMFMGISPGNVGSMSYLDVYRRESQRDFADGSGVLSRAIVEGLFGVRPDALAGELTIAPGFPADWNRASLRHPMVDVAFERKGRVDSYIVRSRLPRPARVKLNALLAGASATVRINGAAAAARFVDASGRRLEIVAGPAAETRFEITWRGAAPEIKETAPTTPLPKPARPAVSVSVKRGTLDRIDLRPHFNDRVTEIFRAGKYLSPRSPFTSLSVPTQGIGAWAGGMNAMAEIDDTGLRDAAGTRGVVTLGDELSFATPGPGDTKNIVFTSHWNNYPRSVTVPLSGRAREIQLLMAGSTNPMQSRIDNGEILIEYMTGDPTRLALRNPETWWPIEQDYFVDDYQFRIDAPLPARVDLKTGLLRRLELESFKGRGGTIPGGAATVLEIAIDPSRELESLTVRAIANDVIIGLMAATLVR